MPAAAPIRFGVIGCGSISEQHARALQLIDGARVTAAVSRSPEKARAFAETFHCAAVDSLAALLARPDVDAVVIGTPSGQHAGQGIAAARAGRHVVVEKPLDVTLDRADALIAECRKAGVTLAVISQFRFLDAVQQTKADITTGRLGRLTLGSAYVKWFRPQRYYDSAAWRGTWAMDGGGCLINQSIHAIDQLLYLFGPVRTVRGFVATRAHTIEVEDTAVAALTFAHGGMGHVVGSTAAFPGQAARLELHGTLGSVVFDLGGRVLVREFAEGGADPGRSVREPDEHVVGVEGAADPKAITVENHRRQFADAIEAIRSHREPAVNGPEGRRALALIMAIYESGKTGREVIVDA